MKNSVPSPAFGAAQAAAQPPLDHDKAQWLSFIGKKRPPGGWPKGLYAARYAVWRAGKVAVVREFQVRL